MNSVDTDSFIMWLRFIGHHGNVRMLRFDNGSNFIGAEKELSKGFLEMDQNKIRRFLQNFGNVWIIWECQKGQYWYHYSELTDPA